MCYTIFCCIVFYFYIVNIYSYFYSSYYFAIEFAIYAVVLLKTKSGIGGKNGNKNNERKWKDEGKTTQIEESN